jgi:DNA modification methylase
MDLITFETEQPTPLLVMYNDDCLNILKSLVISGTRYDAIITDPPYEIGLHRKGWDQTGVSFAAELWQMLHTVLKPGGFIAAFAAGRLYHRLATAAEDAGFEIYPFLAWCFANGLPKPINVSELFDRDNLAERAVLGQREGSGFTRANVRQGAQNRSTTRFAVRARHVSPEAQQWRGWYYGVNCFKPALEPILLAQRPRDGRSIDNLRQHGVGALNLGALQDRCGHWPTTILEHAKARRAEHDSDHPSVKPVALMADLCRLLCPPGGHILDPFAGTGTTGLAAQQLGFDCTLIEIDPSMASVINRRCAVDGARDHCDVTHLSPLHR